MKVLRIIVACCSALGLSGGLFAAAIKPADGSAAAKKSEALFPDKVIATGKGLELKQSEVEEAFMAFRSNLAAQGQNIAEGQRHEIESKLADRLVVNKILLQKASDDDRRKASESTDKTIAETRSRFPSEEIFSQQLKARGLTVDDFRKRLLEQNTCEEVLNRELRAKIKVSDEQLKKFYDENPAKFEEAESVRASHILLSTKDKDTQKPLSPELKKTREGEIRKLKTRAEAGEDFAMLAKEFSEDPGSKDKGGEYTFPRGQMVKPFETAAFSLKTNQVSDVVETEFGYHIIKLHERMPARKVELATVKTNLSSFLVQQEMEKQLPGFFEKLKQDYSVKMTDAAPPATATPPVDAGKAPSTPKKSS